MSTANIDKNYTIQTSTTTIFTTKYVQDFLTYMLEVLL